MSRLLAVLLLWPALAWGQASEIAHVQSVEWTVGGTGTSITTSSFTAIGTNDFIVGFINGTSTVTVVSITDSTGRYYNLLPTVVWPASSHVTMFWSDGPITGNPTTITVTLAASDTIWQILFDEYSGVAYVNTGAGAYLGTGSAAPSQTLVPGHRALLWGGANPYSGTCAAGSGFTLRINDTGGIYTEDGQGVGPGSVAVSFGTCQTGVVLAAALVASGGPAQKHVTFSANGTFNPSTIPDWPGFADREDVMGSGGAGSLRNSASFAGQGGGGGEYAGEFGQIAITSSKTVTVGTASGTVNSSFPADSVTVTANYGAAATTTVAGAGGTGSTNGLHFNGATGGASGSSSTARGGGGGGGPHGPGLTPTTGPGGAADGGKVAGGSGAVGNAGTAFDGVNGPGSAGAGATSTGNGFGGGNYGGGGGAHGTATGGTAAVGTAGFVEISYTPNICLLASRGVGC